MSLVPESRPAAWPDPRDAAGLRVPAETEYHFLLGRFIDAATLARANILAAKWGVHPHDVLIANGWLDADDYCKALAETCGVAFKAPPAKANPRQCLANGILKERRRARRFVLAPERLRPNALRVMLTQLAPYDFTFATPRAVRDVVYRHFAPHLARGAVEALAARRPEQSARTRMARWQSLALASAVTGLAIALLLAPIDTIRVLTLLLAIVFVPVIGLRAVAAYRLLRRYTENGHPPSRRVPDAELPVYTILAPLYREAHMLPSLVHALTLDIKLILEAADRETVAAARGFRLPGNIEIVVVPDLQPRTKPKALNYALPLARGEYLVIYDAEDRPERDQLRRAYHAFRSSPPNVATVQARLNIYNPRDSWLTRQFALEYSALFDGLLPTLDRFRLPIPLGGTSNHFRGIR